MPKDLTSHGKREPCYPNPVITAIGFTSVRFGGSSPLAPTFVFKTINPIQKNDSHRALDRGLRTGWEFQFL